MSELNNKDFDLMVRSAMENGEQQVPAGMWESISARMDADKKAVAGGRRRRLGWMLGLAVAGAATILVMLRPAGIEERSVSEEIAAAAAQETVEMPVTEEVIEVVEAKAEKKVVAKVAALEKAEMVVPKDGGVKEIAPANEIDSEKVSVKENTIEEVPAVGPEHTATPKYSFADDNDSDAWGMVEKNRKKGWKAQLTALTSTGGNIGKHNRSIGRSASRSVDFGGSKITENECTFVSIPVTFGIGLKIHFNEHWALGTGITYTYLGRKFSGTYDNGAIEKYTCSEISNDQHYFGIPVNVYFNFVAANNFNFYAFAGGAIDKCVSNRYWFDYGGTPMYLRNSVNGFQFSATLGVGMQYNFNRLLSIYLDPEFKYYFENSKQPKSIRTTQPFQLGCELGLRFNL